MNENGNRYAIAALRERRAALDGEIKECDRKLRYLREAIGHIDATLSLFDPNGDPKKITAKRPYKRVKLFASGKLGRLVLDALRRGARPMTTREIVASIVEKVGYGPDAAKGMSHRVRANLLYQSKVVGRVVKTGERETARWSLAD
jgi:hypothetical protein